MAWEIAASVAEIVGALAVVVSLIYLAREVRQNTVASRATMHQQYIDAQMNANRGVSDDPEISTLIANANKDYELLSESELIRLQFVFWNHFNQWHLAFTTQKHSMLETEMFDVVTRGYSGYIQSSVAFRNMWKASSFAYDKAFQEHVESVIAGASDAPNYPGLETN